MRKRGEKRWRVKESFGNNRPHASRSVGPSHSVLRFVFCSHSLDTPVESSHCRPSRQVLHRRAPTNPHPPCHLSERHSAKDSVGIVHQLHPRQQTTNRQYCPPISKPHNTPEGELASTRHKTTRQRTKSHVMSSGP